MDEDITNDEENQNEVNNSQMKNDGVSQGDSNIIVIDEDNQNEYGNKHSETPDNSDTIYIDDNNEKEMSQKPDIDIGRMKIVP